MQFFQGNHPAGSKTAGDSFLVEKQSRTSNAQAKKFARPLFTKNEKRFHRALENAQKTGFPLHFRIKQPFSAAALASREKLQFLP